VGKIRASRPPRCALRNPKKQNSRFCVKPCQVVVHARACTKSEFSTTLILRASGGKAVELVVPDVLLNASRSCIGPLNRPATALDTSHVSCAHVPKEILCNPSNQRKQQLALTSPTWARGFSRVLRHSACSRGAKNEVPMQRRARAVCVFA